MNPTTDKIQLSQADYNNIADWAKPNYTVAPNSVASNVPLQQPQSAIPSTALQPVQNIKVPEVKPVDTGSQAIIASTQPSIDTALQNFEQVKQATGTDAEDARSALTKLAESIFGQKADAQANQAELEKQLGLDEQQKALSQINTEMANEQVALRNEEEKIRQGYGTEAQKAISRQTLQDTYGRRLADLAIRQAAANANITAIQTAAERKTKLITDALDTKINYLQTFAKDNVDYLDKKQSEKLAFITDNLKTQKADIQALENAKAQMITEIANNGGGTNTALITRIQNAKTLGDVTSIGASSGFVGLTDRLYKNAQISKIYADMNTLAGSSGVVAGQKPTGKADPITAAYANRTVSANKVIDSLSDKFSSATAIGGILPNIVQSADRQQYEQAKRDFVNAVLRKESGAAISPTEFSSAEIQYFPRAGDSAEVVRQKELNRVNTINGLIGSAGSAYNGTYLYTPPEYKGDISQMSNDELLGSLGQSNSSVDNKQFYSNYFNQLSGKKQ